MLLSVSRDLWQRNSKCGASTRRTAHVYCPAALPDNIGNQVQPFTRLPLRGEAGEGLKELLLIPGQVELASRLQYRSYYSLPAYWAGKVLKGHGYRPRLAGQHSKGDARNSLSTHYRGLAGVAAELGTVA